MDSISTCWLKDGTNTDQNRPPSGTMGKLYAKVFGSANSPYRFEMSDLSDRLGTDGPGSKISFSNDDDWETTITEALKQKNLSLLSPNEPVGDRKPLIQSLIDGVRDRSMILSAPLFGIAIGYLLSGGRCSYNHMVDLVKLVYKIIFPIETVFFLHRKWNQRDYYGSRGSIIGFGKRLHTNLQVHGRGSDYSKWRMSLLNKDLINKYPIPRPFVNDPVLGEHVCSISLEPIRYPVYRTLEDGTRQYFEQATIFAWLEEKKENPATFRGILKKSDLTYDRELSAQIEKRLIFAKIALHRQFPDLKECVTKGNDQWVSALGIMSSFAASCFVN